MKIECSFAQLPPNLHDAIRPYILPKDRELYCFRERSHLGCVITNIRLIVCISASGYSGHFDLSTVELHNVSRIQEHASHAHRAFVISSFLKPVSRLIFDELIDRHVMQNFRAALDAALRGSHASTQR